MGQSDHFMGLDGFVWFVGVVEDRNDPSKLGRVRVRCLGYHTSDKVLIPTEDLPWAHVMHPITSPSMQGMGSTPSFLVEGTWVMGFFMQADMRQQPMIMGSLPGNPYETGDSSKGFHDPNGFYPQNPNSISGHDLEESDTNRLARNDVDVDGVSIKQHTMLTSKDTGYTKEVLTANSSHIIGDTTATVDASATVDTINPTTTSTQWNEPLTTDNSSKKDEDENPIPRYAALYPKNHVFETESGHIKEYDDTLDAERIHEYHKSGTFYEIDTDGNKVTRIIGNNYHIIAGTDFVNIKGDVNLTIDSNCKTYIKGDWDIQVDGNVNEVIKGTMTQAVTGAVSETYKDTKTENVTGAVSETYQANQTTNITGTLDLDASTEVDIDAGTINLN